LIKSNFFTELTVASRFSRSDERTAVFAKASTCSVEMFFQEHGEQWPMKRAFSFPENPTRLMAIRDYFSFTESSNDLLAVMRGLGLLGDSSLH
jgi:hypothetical protein